MIIAFVVSIVGFSSGTLRNWSVFYSSTYILPVRLDEMVVREALLKNAVIPFDSSLTSFS